MTAALVDGTALAKSLAAAVAPRAAAVKAARGRPPQLAIFSAAQSREAKAYLRSIEKACAGVDIEAATHEISPSEGQAEVLRRLRRVQADPRVDAVLVDMPLPGGIDAEAVTAAIDPSKDAEGVGSTNLGRLFAAKSYSEIRDKRIPVPCTALAVAELLRSTKTPLEGRRAVVVGRSTIVGKPAAHLLSSLDLTVTLCHSKTRDLPGEVAQADVVVACLGRARFVQGAWIKPGAIVIDAGTNDGDGKLVGDVDFGPASQRAGFITPVPGGVGPVTTALLLSNIVTLAEGRGR